MHLIPDDRGSRLSALTRGDFVEVRLNAALNSGFIGYIRAKGEFLHLNVHTVFGQFETEPGNDAVPETADECLAMSVVVPLSSVAWIRHLPNKPVDCACEEEKG